MESDELGNQWFYFEVENVEHEPLKAYQLRIEHNREKWVGLCFMFIY